MSRPTQMPANPVVPLKGLSAGLGQAGFDWARREQRWVIDCEFAAVDQAVATQLTPELLNACVAAYGPGITEFAFYTEALPELDCTAGVSQEDLERLVALLQQTKTVSFRFTLDKRVLLKAWFDTGNADCTSYLYLFEEAFSRFIALAALHDIEHLWAEAPTAKVLVFIPTYAHILDGPLLAVIGGSGFANWRAYLPQQAYPKAELDAMTEVRANAIHWEENWVRFLTPRHLQVSPQLDSDLAVRIAVHWVNLVILYTARQVKGQGQPGRGVYSDIQHTVDVPFLAPGQNNLDTIGAAELAFVQQLWQWCYENKFEADRLEFLQIVAAQYLFATDEKVRCYALIHNAEDIFTGLKWHWRAFLEKKINGYTKQVRELEAYVEQTVDAYTKQVSEMVSSLSETVLTAVATVLGTFIAYLVSDKVSLPLIAVGMFLYGLYVLVFPYRFQFKNQHERFKITSESFEKQSVEFGRYLYPERVREIIGERITQSQKRYRKWAEKTETVYMFLAILAFGAALLSILIWLKLLVLSARGVL